jgi:hypothetical protein
MEESVENLESFVEARRGGLTVVRVANLSNELGGLHWALRVRSARVLASGQRA